MTPTFSRTLLVALTLFSGICAASAATPRARDFQPMCDSLRTLLRERTGVDQKDLKMTRVRARGNSVLDLYFSSELSYYPWHEDDIRWFRTEILNLWDDAAGTCRLGRIFTNRYELPQLVLPVAGNDGKPSGYDRSIPDPREDNGHFVTREGARRFPLGLDGRNIALWQSHGRYYDEASDCWLWQRACLHRTVEDMFSPSFVLPFLIPMLENSGAYILTPRERDTQWREIIADNDPAFKDERTDKMRRSGRYSESGRWKDAGEGFADFKSAYTFSDNPFTAGTARMAECNGSRANARAVWTAEIEERGSYAVYVSWKTLENSSDSAHYTVNHLGGSTEFIVNQKRGGGTWIYLGTFEFPEGDKCSVMLDNRGPEGSVVTADAVKIGGGMGKLERGGRTSGVASWEEGAHYWMQWAGADSTVTRNWDTDYTNDFAARGRWTVMMNEQKSIPIDLSLAFHTDAGLAQADSTIGTLAIYTLRCDGEREFSDGRDRIISRLLCDYVQTQVVEDIRASFDSTWARRGLWDKSYSESRTTGVPAMILELMSHQNLADMKYGLDPSFRFTVCRAVYKGILKTLSEYYGCDYTVQPLPVHAFSVRFIGDDRVRLEWKPTEDPAEPTAVSSGYTVYTRVDDGCFDAGTDTDSTWIELPLRPGHLYSFKVEAFNAGGRSFPSEILSAGIPDHRSDGRTVLIVNNFDRVSSPEWVDTPEFAGFVARMDSGVPYIRDIGFVGENYEFDRSVGFIDNDYPGFGASYSDYAGRFVAGNTFDFPSVHGKALMQLGYSFCSASKAAFCDSTMTFDAFALDLICGKQRRTKIGRGAVPDRFEVFPDELCDALADFAGKGGCIFISGSNIASDCDESTAAFTKTLFGYSLATPDAGRYGKIGDMEYSSRINPEIYCVESPDGLKAAGHDSGIWMTFPDSHLGAAVWNDSGNFRTVSLTVPLETFLSETDRTSVLGAVMRWFSGEGSSPTCTTR